MKIVNLFYQLMFEFIELYAIAQFIIPLPIIQLTSFDLALGPDLPRADQLYSGNLRYSANRILTYFSLLIPAFSLLNSPHLLPVMLRRVTNAPLPIM